MFRSSSPYRTPETQYQPYPQQVPQPQATQARIVPGSITYTTSTGPDGQILYHPFKAVEASYKTPSGIVSGIQWVPAEATQVIPAGALPANSTFAEAWGGGQVATGDQTTIKDWQKAEEKRRRREEKEASRQLRERSLSRGDPDAELRRARERDAAARGRRKSFNQGTSPMIPAATPGQQFSTTPYGYNGAAPLPPAQQPVVPPYGTPQVPAAGYPAGVDRRYTAPNMADLNQQFADMGIPERERKISTGGGLARPMKYNTMPETTVERARRLSGNFGSTYPPPALPIQGGPYPGADTGTTGFIPGYPSNVGPPRRSTSPMPYAAPVPGVKTVYPPGHVLEGQPIPPSLSRSTTPIPQPGPAPFPGGSNVQFPQPTIPMGPSPEQRFQQLSQPACFNRPVNTTQPYASFMPMKIQDMDEFFDKVPKMPLALAAHDVYQEDWGRLMADLSAAWTGRLPAPNARPPKRSTVTADLIDMWNASFFLRRGVEIVLYKGRERRSGANAGTMDLPEVLWQDQQFSSSSDDSDANEEADLAYGYYRPAGPGSGSMAEVLEMRRRRNQFRAEKKRQREEHRARKRNSLKTNDRKYSLVLTCTRPNGPGQPVAYPIYNR